jgi:hypothetical protein
MLGCNLNANQAVALNVAKAHCLKSLESNHCDDPEPPNRIVLAGAFRLVSFFSLCSQANLGERPEGQHEHVAPYVR